MRDITLITATAMVTGLVPMASGKVIHTIAGYAVTYPAGKIGGSSAIGLPAQYVKIPPAQEYFLDYQVWFENDWEWVRGGKLPGLVGGSHTSGCNSIVPDGWSARFMWGQGGKGTLYLYHQNRRSGCGDSYGFSGAEPFRKNAWNRITQRVRINAPGQSDGLIETWFNGNKVVTLANVKLRGNVGAQVALVDQVSLQTFYGGSTSNWAPPHTTHARFSQFIVTDSLPNLALPFTPHNLSTGIRSERGAWGNPRFDGKPEGWIRFDGRGRLVAGWPRGLDPVVGPRVGERRLLHIR